MHEPSLSAAASATPRPAGLSSEKPLAALVAICVALALFLAATRQSLTVDEPFHLLAGLEMHQHGQNLLNLEHPPLVKWLAAWPLAGEPALAVPAIRAGLVMKTWELLFGDPAATFRYIWRSRAILVALIALPLLWLAFALGRRFGGVRAGLALAAFVGLAAASLPYLVLSQTDAAVALGFLATLLAAIRYAEAPSFGRAAWLGAALGLALAAKFSGLLLGPTVLLACWLGGRRKPRQWPAALLVLAVAGTLLWGSYRVANLDYRSERGRVLISDYAAGGASLIVGDRLLPFEDLLLRIETGSPELAQLLTGILGVRAQNELGVYATVVFGRLTSHGRWYFFPLKILTLTSLVLLAASLAALIAWWRRRPAATAVEPSDPGPALAITTLAVYLGVALVSSYNVGIRHLLPIFPLLFLPAAVWCGERRGRAFAVVLLLAAESFWLAPGWISATNTWWLGERNPTATAYSTMAYKQSYYALAEELEERGIVAVRVLQPIVFDAELRSYIPGASAVDPGQPLVPGWYAVYIQAEQLLPALFAVEKSDFYHFDNYRRAGLSYFERWQELVRRGEDHGYLAGNTFHLYRIP